MKKYLDLLRLVRDTGTRQANRTGIDAISIPGAMMQFDLQEGFPLLTTKKMAWGALKGELIAFLRGSQNAAEFRELGCNFWDQNANENQAWLNNPMRKGHDDLGRVYGAQWREWLGKMRYVDDSGTPEGDRSAFRLKTKGSELGVYNDPIDQVMTALNTIHKDPTSRRIIINAWRPDEFHCMALPPCHVLYQFIVNVERREINLCMYQRSADMFLGVPMNVGSSALLLSMFAHLTGYTPRFFTHFLADAHIYVNHLDQVEEQLSREPKELPRLVISPRIPTFAETGVFQPEMIDQFLPEDFGLAGYDPWPSIRAEMAV